MKPKPGNLYLCDNGACYCYDHLGSSAKHTGRDISGQKIETVTPSDAIACAAEFGVTLRCESCGSHA